MAMEYFEKPLAFLFELKKSLAAAAADYFSYRHVRVYTLLFLALNPLLWILSVMIMKQGADNLIVLHYNIDVGVNLIGAPIRIMAVPLFGLAAVIFNSVLAACFHNYRDFPFLSYLLLTAAAVTNALLALSAGAIYYING